MERDELCFGRCRKKEICVQSAERSYLYLPTSRLDSPNLYPVSEPRWYGLLLPEISRKFVLLDSWVELGEEDGTHNIQTVIAVGGNETESVAEDGSFDRSSESNEKQNLVLAKQNSLSKQSEEIKEQGDAILHVVSDTRNELQSYYVAFPFLLNARETSVFPFPR